MIQNLANIKILELGGFQVEMEKTYLSSTKSMKFTRSKFKISKNLTTVW